MIMNKLKHIIAPLLLPFALPSLANQLTVADIEVEAGESAELVVNFETTATNWTGYQMSIYLPEGVTLQKDEDDEYLYTLSSRHNKSHSCTISQQTDGGLLLVCYSLTKKTIAAGTGELLRLPVNVASTATGNLTAQFRNIKFSDTNSNVSQLSDVTATFTVMEKPLIDQLTVSDMNVVAGSSADIVVNFATSATNLTGYQMSLYLPEGITLQKDEDDEYMYELSSRHNRSHSCTVSQQTDGGLLLVCYSLTKKTIAAGTGELLRLPLNVSATASGTLTAQLKGIKFSDVNSTVNQLDDVSFSIYVQGQTQEPVAQTLSLTSLPAMTYGDGAYTLPAKTTEGLTLTWTSSNTSVATISSGKLTIKKAGSATITATQAGNDSYLPFSRQFSLTVGKANLTITANSCEKTQGEENPELTVSYSGFKYSDTPASLTKQPTVSTTATKDSPAGTYPITVSGAESANYTFSYVSGTLTVTETPDMPVPTDISQLNNAIYIEPFAVRIGDNVNIEICLKNAEAATAYVFDLVLPEGVTVAKNDKGKFIDALSDRHDDHTRTFNDKGNNTYSLSTLSGNSEELTGNDGAIRLLTLSAAEDLAEGVYAVEIKNASYSKPDGTLVPLPNTISTVTVEDYLLGDVNGNGGVDIGDAVTIVNYLVGKESTTFVEKAADTNKNGQIDIGDAVTIVNFLVGKTESLSRSAKVLDEKEPQ